MYDYCPMRNQQIKVSLLPATKSKVVYFISVENSPSFVRPYKENSFLCIIFKKGTSKHIVCAHRAYKGNVILLVLIPSALFNIKWYMHACY
jgi:hypothetical protein